MAKDDEMKKIKKISLLLTLVVLLLGIVTASEVSDDTTTSTDTLLSDTYITTDTITDNVNEEKTEYKQMKKEEDERRNIKQTSKIIDVSDFNTLHQSLTSNTSSNITINIKKDITLTNNTNVDSAIKILTINGNGKTVNGKDKYQFLNITSNIHLTINNITITRCNATNGGVISFNGSGELLNCTFLNNSADMYGGAIYSYSKEIININNSIFSNNKASWGGALTGGLLNITNSIFHNNTATTVGGSICVTDDLDMLITLKNNTFSYNTADVGGVIYTNALGSIDSKNNTYQNNFAGFSGGVIDLTHGDYESEYDKYLSNGVNYAGGALGISDYSTFSLKNNIFADNNAQLQGGTIFNYGKGEIFNNNFTNNIVLNNFTDSDGGVIYNNMGYLNITQNNFNNNNASNGGAIYNNRGYLNIIQNDFQSNIASNGGAIYNFDGNITITANNFINNKAHHYGGAIVNNANTTYNGTNTSNDKSENSINKVIFGKTIISDNIFTKNNANIGGAIRGLSPSTTYYLIIDNNTFVKNTANCASAISNEEGYTNITNNIFKKNKANTPGKAIINFEGPIIIENNINDTTSIYSATIDNDSRRKDNTELIIKYNKFIDEINYTKTSIRTTNGNIGEKLTLKAIVTATDNNKINEGNIIFKLNGITIKDNGKLTGSYNPLIVKVVNGVATTTIIPDLNMRKANNITAKYVGTDNYASSESEPMKIHISQRNASILVSSNVKTIKQGQVLTITAKVYDTTNGKKSTNLVKFADEFVYFKVNGITLKNSTGGMQKVKVVNGTATIKYTIPLGLSGVTDGKTFTVKNHTILAGFYNKNYMENIRNTSIFQVERSNITITISNATVNNRTHKLSLTATIKDYLGNKVVGPNKCIIKVNGVTLKNGTQPIYYFASYGVLNIKNITISAYNKYTRIEIVTQDRLAYKNQRNTTDVIKVVK